MRVVMGKKGKSLVLRSDEMKIARVSVSFEGNTSFVNGVGK